MQRKFRKRTTLRSESSTLKGLLYAPIQRKQYLERTTLSRLKIPLRSIRSKEGPHYCLGAKREQESCHLTSDNQPLFTSWASLVIPTWAVLHSLANARKCQLEDFCEKERYESCPVQWRCTADAFRKVRKGENLPVTKLLPGSHERLTFEKPTCSVSETWGPMYDVLVLRN